QRIFQAKREPASEDLARGVALDDPAAEFETYAPLFRGRSLRACRSSEVSDRDRSTRSTIAALDVAGRTARAVEVDSALLGLSEPVASDQPRASKCRRRKPPSPGHRSSRAPPALTLSLFAQEVILRRRRCAFARARLTRARRRRSRPRT